MVITSHISKKKITNFRWFLRVDVIVFSWFGRCAYRFDNFIESEYKGDGRRSSTQMRPLQPSTTKLEVYVCALYRGGRYSGNEREIWRQCLNDL